MAEVRIERVPADVVLPLRARVLRPGLPIDAARFAGDDEVATIHLAAFYANQCVGCLTLLHAPFDDEPGWQLRGMAVKPSQHRRGIGRALLHATNRHLPAKALLWCNARTPSAGFYEKHGWSTVSGPFDIPGVGPHVRMRRDGPSENQRSVE